MYKSKAWLFLLVLIVGITFWYLVNTAIEVYNVVRLKEPHTPKVEKWEIFESQEEVFYPKVRYSFEKNGTKYSQEEVLRSEEFQNPWALQDKYPEIIDREWIVWCDPSMPSHCSMEKVFPTKRVVYSVILVLICGYFVLLGRYVNKATKL